MNSSNYRFTSILPACDMKFAYKALYAIATEKLRIGLVNDIITCSIALLPIATHHALSTA